MNATMDEREEIEALLPWFVTGKLAEAERVRVELYLAEHPDVARQVALAREESVETIAGAESFGVPSRASFDRLMAEVGRHERRQAGTERRSYPVMALPTRLQAFLTHQAQRLTQ